MFVGEDDDHHAADERPCFDRDLGGETVEAFDGPGVTIEQLGAEIDGGNVVHCSPRRSCSRTSRSARSQRSARSSQATRSGTTCLSVKG